MLIPFFFEWLNFRPNIGFFILFRLLCLLLLLPACYLAFFCTVYFFFMWKYFLLIFCVHCFHLTRTVFPLSHTHTHTPIFFFSYSESILLLHFLYSMLVVIIISVFFFYLDVRLLFLYYSIHFEWLYVCLFPLVLLLVFSYEKPFLCLQNIC